MKILQRSVGSGLGHVTDFFRVPVSVPSCLLWAARQPWEVGTGIRGTERLSPLPRATQ